MRITNRIIQNNSLTNINTNKILQDKLSTQLSTEKKISRPSEDPIIALRSLRLRTSVNQTDQYLNKNVTDARSWLTVTEDAIDTLSEIITDIRKQYTKGTSDTLTVSDRGIIKESLEAFSQEIYNTGNADFAGRSVFTGYRTESPLTYQKNEQVFFSIQQSFLNEPSKEESLATVRDTITYVEMGDLTASGATEQQVKSHELYRYRLAYDNCGANYQAQISLPDGTSVNTRVVFEKDNPYQEAVDNPGEFIYVPETGEIITSEENTSAILTTDEEITISFTKQNWSKGELKPEHYFRCTKQNADGTVVDYNMTAVPGKAESRFGEIEYNVGVNQSMRVNTLASDCFTHDISRDIDDMINCIEEVENIEKTLKELETKLKGLPETDTAGIKETKDQIDAAKKAQTFLSDKLHRMFSSGITKSDNYLNKNNVALTDCGTRSKRLDLIENRLDTQMSTLEELKSDNEDIDMAETAIRLTSAEHAYDAALMATGKILQDSLLNYI